MSLLDLKQSMTSEPENVRKGGITPWPAMISSQNTSSKSTNLRPHSAVSSVALVQLELAADLARC